MTNLTQKPAPPLTSEPKKVPVDPKAWDAISVACVVLGAGFDKDDLPAGWWEAIVVKIENDTYSLRWRDYPREPIVTRERKHLALIHP